MTVVSGLFSTAFLPTRFSTSRLLFVKRVAQRRAIFVSRLPQASSASVSVETNSTVAEISRVLRPGGLFVASTFIFDGPLSFIPFMKILHGEIMRYTGSQIFLSERELEDICRACGLVGALVLETGHL